MTLLPYSVLADGIEILGVGRKVNLLTLWQARVKVVEP